MTEPTKQRPGDQPLPTIGRECVQDRLVQMVLARKEIGISRYGSALMTHNGRDALQDAFEEAVDLAAYLTQLSMERDDETRAVRRLLNALTLWLDCWGRVGSEGADDLRAGAANAAGDVLALFIDRFAALDAAASDSKTGT
jgi:hypothetical protein